MSERRVPPSADLPEARVGELHALYREGAAIEPDARLDQRILEAARADLAAHPAKPPRARVPWWKAWLKPVSVVAVAVLGLSLTWQISDQQERDRRQEIDSTEDQPKAPESASPGAAAPPPRLAALANKAQEPAVKQRAPATRSAPAEAPAATAPRAFPAQQESARSTIGAASGSVARPAPEPLPAPPPAAPSEKKNRSVETGEARAKDDGSVRGEAAAPASAPAKLEAARRADTSAAGANALEKSAGETVTPQAWLQQIRELRAAGREAEAAQSLSRFRTRYPDFVLPEDLKAPK
jgi:resuscitation-promoting factor RpfA